MVTRTQIVEKAREYLGTPFRHQGRAKGRGVDCAGLLICVARDLGVRDPAWDVSHYGHLPNGGQLQDHMARNMQAIALSDSDAGDVLLMSFGNEPQHIAIKTSKDYIIHSYAQVRKVVEHRVDQQWSSRIVGAFRFNELEG